MGGAFMAPLVGLWFLQKRLWLWLTRWNHFFRWAKVILKNHLTKRLIGCFSERPLYSLSLLYVARDWGQDQKNNLDWWEGYCAKKTWAEAGWATFFGSCPLVHFGKALHSWSHLKNRCLAQLLHEPEPKLKNKPYQRGPMFGFWLTMSMLYGSVLYINSAEVGTTYLSVKTSWTRNKRSQLLSIKSGSDPFTRPIIRLTRTIILISCKVIHLIMWDLLVIV
jgi:hypothetical protein